MTDITFTASGREIADFCIEGVEHTIRHDHKTAADWTGEQAVAAYAYEGDSQTSHLGRLTPRAIRTAEILIDGWLAQRTA